jgi:hypothetical protein
MNGWFEVDKEGLANIVARRPKAFLVFELLQNAWDEDVTKVTCDLEMVPNKQLCNITVVDNSPDGFRSLRHAFVLFAESYKKSDPTKRGRFDLGEKLVLSLCKEAAIYSTKGGVKFLENGKRVPVRKKRKRGSAFEALVKMTRKEYDEICREVKRLIPPKNIKTYFNGGLLVCPHPAAIFQTKLPTEISDGEGRLKRTIRQTSVEVYHPETGEGWIYEMGIPIVETGDKFHINIMQKVPLNMDRDNVTPSYLRTVRTEVLNHTIDLIDDKEANETWVKEATSDERCTKEAVVKTLDKRFGEKRVIFDPSDLEANKIAVSKGYTVLVGGALSKAEWTNVKKSGGALPAGQVTPSDKITSSPDGIPPLTWDQLTDSQKNVIKFAEFFGYELLGVKVIAQVNKIDVKSSAWYGQRTLTFNLKSLGHRFFNNFPDNIEEVVDICIHEFAHEYSSDHFSDKYYKALSALGAKSTMMVYNNPNIFKMFIERICCEN